MSTVAINIDENSVPRKEDYGANAIIDCQLYQFVKQDNIEDFKRLVLHPQIEKLVTPCGNSLLHVAVRHGSDGITAYLAGEFPSLITSRILHEDTVLHLAARYGRVSRTIRTLAHHISNASLLKMTNRKGNTPLHDAVIKGHKEFVVWLVRKEPEVAYYNNNTGKSPLYPAVENNDKNGILDDLLNTEASIPIEIEDGKSPVHAAIEQRNIGILEKIETAKPELFCLKDKGLLGNPLHYASNIAYLEGVRFLLEKFRASANEANQEGNYPIHLACKNDSALVVKEFLKVIPYPYEFFNKKGQNILHVAAENGRGNVVRYILQQDQNLVEPLLNEMDEDGNTPLHLAAQHGQSIAAFVLVHDKRVDHSKFNNEDLTPYEIAVRQSKIALEQYEKSDEMDGQVHSKDVKDGMKNSTIEKSSGSTSSQGKDKAVDPKKQDTEKASPKAYKLLDSYRALTTLSILYFHARPGKSIPGLFTSTQGEPPTKEETNRQIENLLVVAVLVAGVTFAGAMQLPPVRGNHSSNELIHDFKGFWTVSGSSLPNSYVGLNAWALSISSVAALILLLTNFMDNKFAPRLVRLSSLLVCLSIYMMLVAFFCAVNITLGGSREVVYANISLVGAIICALVQVMLHSPGYSASKKLEEMLFPLIYYPWTIWVSYNLNRRRDTLSDLKKKPK